MADRDILLRRILWIAIASIGACLFLIGIFQMLQWSPVYRSINDLAKWAEESKFVSVEAGVIERQTAMIRSSAICLTGVGLLILSSIVHLGMPSSSHRTDR